MLNQALNSAQLWVVDGSKSLPRGAHTRMHIAVVVLSPVCIVYFLVTKSSLAKSFRSSQCPCLSFFLSGISLSNYSIQFVGIFSLKVFIVTLYVL